MSELADLFVTFHFYVVSMKTIHPVRSSSTIAQLMANFVTGWGDLSTHGLSSNHLHQVYLEWVEQAVCEHDMGSRFIPEDMICAGDVQHGGRDTCQVSLSLLPPVYLSFLVCLSIINAGLKQAIIYAFASLLPFAWFLS